MLQKDLSQHAIIFQMDRLHFVKKEEQAMLKEEKRENQENSKTVIQRQGRREERVSDLHPIVLRHYMCHGQGSCTCRKYIICLAFLPLAKQNTFKLYT